MGSLSLSLLRLICSLRHVLLLQKSRNDNDYPRADWSIAHHYSATEALPRPHLVAWEQNSPADRRQLQNSVTYYTLMNISGQISKA